MMCQHKNKSVSISTYRPYRASTVSDRIDDIMSNPNQRNHHREERADLFGGPDGPLSAGQGGLRRRRRRPRPHEDAAQGSGSSASAREEARGIADSLLRTKAIMKQELERVSHVTDAIGSDGAMLRGTRETHEGTGNTVGGAKRALRALKAQERRDTGLLWASVAFFYLAALYVFWTRVRIPFLLW